DSDCEKQKKLAKDLLAFSKEIQEILPILNEKDDDIFANM
ncbi:2477_t:CDS:1, partial [Funneliformis caledonium]